MLDVRVYSIFVFSILRFYVQFHPATPDMLRAEATACRRLFKGPGGWAPKYLLHALRPQLGAPYELPDLQMVALGSKIRLYLQEGFLQQQNRLQHLKALYHQYFGARPGIPVWYRWFKGGIPEAIYGAKDSLQDQGITEQELRSFLPHPNGKRGHDEE